MKKVREQRRDLRLPNRYPVEMIVDKSVAHKGITKDISRQGAFIVTEGKFRIGQTIAIESQSIRLGYEKRICTIVRAVQNGVGIQCGKSLHTEFSTPQSFGY